MELTGVYPVLMVRDAPAAAAWSAASVTMSQCGHPVRVGRGWCPRPILRPACLGPTPPFPIRNVVGSSIDSDADCPNNQTTG